MNKRWTEMWELFAPEGGEGGDAGDAGDAEDKGLLSGGEGDGDGDGGDEGDGDKPEGDKVAVPESYTFEVPEGKSIDPAAVEAYTPILKDLGLTQEQADKLFAVQTELADKQVERMTAQSNEWLEEVKNDPELGGEKLKATAAGLDMVMSKYGDADLIEFLDLAGLTNHPGLVRFVSKIAKALGEDSVSGGGRTGGAPTTEEDRLKRAYPTMFGEAS